jgi:hypothetical protein
MKIQAGHEISYSCSQPTPMILMLSVHPSRITDLITPDRLQLDPAIPANSYRDGFGIPATLSTRRRADLPSRQIL